MKKYLIICVISFLCLSVGKKNEDFSKVAMYLESWKTKSKIPITINNIEKKYSYYFEKGNSDFYSFIFDYEQFSRYLDSQTVINESNNLSRVCVVMYFGEKKIKLFFKTNGNYYFNNKWYKLNPCLYYNLFYSFSNSLLPEETLKRAKVKMEEQKECELRNSRDFDMEEN